MENELFFRSNGGVLLDKRSIQHQLFQKLHYMKFIPTINTQTVYCTWYVHTKLIQSSNSVDICCSSCYVPILSQVIGNKILTFLNLSSFFNAKRYYLFQRFQLDGNGAFCISSIRTSMWRMNQSNGSQRCEQIVVQVKKYYFANNLNQIQRINFKWRQINYHTNSTFFRICSNFLKIREIFVLKRLVPQLMPHCLLSCQLLANISPDRIQLLTDFFTVSI